MRPLPGRMKSQGRPPSLGRNSRQRAVCVSDFQPSPAPAATAIHPPLQALQDLLAVTPVGVGGDAGLTARGVAILHSPCMPPTPCLLPAGLPPKSRPHCSPVPPAWSSSTQAQTFSSSSTTLHPLQVPTPDSSLFSILRATAHPISSSESIKASTCMSHTPPASCDHM